MSVENNVLEIVSELIQEIGTTETVTEFVRTTIKNLKKYLPLDFLQIYYISTDNLISKSSSFNGLEEVDFSTAEFKTILQKYFTANELKFYKNDTLQPDLLELIDKKETMSSIVAFQPLISKGQLLGIIIFGLEKSVVEIKQEFKIALKNIIEFIETMLFNRLQIERLSKENEVFRGQTKKMRHDFANDLQSISLTIELLDGTDFTDDQKKYLDILNRAIDKANEKIRLMKKQKRMMDEKEKEWKKLKWD
jgi:hypothetical protein